MILADNEIADAISGGLIDISPEPGPSQYSSTALDLRVGKDFRRWKSALGTAQGLKAEVDLDSVDLSTFLELTEPVTQEAGFVLVAPKEFVFVRTLEFVHLKRESQLAARVEGRSTTARLGMTAHISAPTIHAGFYGHIVLEIINHGPFTIKLKPEKSCIAQLIFERVGRVPDRGIMTKYLGQTTPLGTPKPK